MRPSNLFRAGIPRACAALLAIALGSSAFGQSFRTTSFNAKLKINADRTITVDETILILPTDGPLTGIAFAEAPKGSRPIQFLVNRSTVGSAELPVRSDGNAITANIPTPADKKAPLQIHLNYSALGAFTDRSGGTLGSRGTMSWNLVPASWPSAIESSQLEVEYPNKALPVYVGVNTGEGANRAAIEKTQATAFSGKLDTFDVSEGEDGIVMKPPNGIPANSGLHLLIALSKNDLKPAPARLTAPKPAAVTTSKPTSSPRQPALKPAAQEPAVPKQPSLGLLLLPLFPPVLFFFLYLKRFSFLRGRSFPTSAIPEGIGPAEAGFILEGSLKARHVIGALSALADGGLSKPGSATVDPETLGPVERRTLEIIKRRSASADPKQLKTFLNGSLQDLQAVTIQNLDQRDILYPSAKRGRVVPAITLLMTLAIAGYFAFQQDPMKGGIFTGLGVLLGAVLLFSLSPLTQKGARVQQKIAGLDKFLTAHTSEFKSSEAPDYLEHLRPYAIAFGIAKEEQ